MPQLQGRDDELAGLAALLARNTLVAGDRGADRAGSAVAPRAVLLGGDAGMGKTRLLLELAGRARSSGWRVLVGHCLDLADQLLPYLPFTEMVGRFADDEPALVAEVAERHPALAALAPGRRLLAVGDTAGNRTTLDPSDDVPRAQILDGVQGFFETLATHGPVLVVLEDLHWADQSTRDLVSFLLSRPSRGDVRFVASYRTDDLHRRHPLRASVAGWSRLPGLTRTTLSPLADPAMGALVRELSHAAGRGAAPQGLRERDVAMIVERAEGNAFFAEELVVERQAGSPEAVPATLADVLLLRLDRLDDQARTVVKAAACAGRRVSHDLLATVVDLPDAELDQALRTAVDSNVLVHRGADGYGFRHALLAETVHDDLLPGERVRLHARYVDALRSGRVEGTAAELTMHARSAHDLPTAVRAGIQAGDEAMAVGGPEDAARHFASALELAARPSAGGSEGDAEGAAHNEAPVDLVALVRRTSEALIASGQPGRARALVRDHLDAVPADLPEEERIRLLLAYAAAALLNETHDEPTRETGEALRLLGEEPSRLRARALSLHARALTNGQHDEEAARYAGEALALAGRFDLTGVVGEAATTLAALDGRTGDDRTALTALEDVVATAREAGDTAGEMRGRYLAAQLQLERGRLAQAQESFAKAVEAARRAGRPWAPYGFEARFQQASTAYLRGDWDEALAVANVVGEAPPADAEAMLGSLALLVRAGRGDRSVLEEYDTLWPSWEREGLVALNSAAAVIDLAGADGDLETVQRLFDEAVEVLSRHWRPLFHARIRLSALVLGHLGSAVSRTPSRDRPAMAIRAQELLDVVDDIAARSQRSSRGFGPEGEAWVSRARAEHLRFGWLAGADVPDLAVLVDAWTLAVDGFEVLGHPFERARSQARLAAVLLASGAGEEAAGPVVAAARKTAERLVARPLLAELAALGSRPARHSTRRPGDRAAPAAHSEELTRREHEVVRLVAEGRSNGEIAKALFISTKTVSVHVSNILAKLGAAGRTEAAAIARRKGLLG